jgi:hypothetical protein
VQIKLGRSHFTSALSDCDSEAQISVYSVDIYNSSTEFGLELAIFNNKIEAKNTGNKPNTNELNKERLPHKQTSVLL